MTTTGWALACFVVLLSAYFSTLPATITDADAGEFLVIAKTGGIAHPPGYPLFVLICRILASADRWVALVTLIAGFSAVCVATAGALLVRMLQPLADVRAVAFAVVLVFLSPEVWRQANAAEPFALNLLLAATIVGIGVQLLTAPIDTTPGRIGIGAALLGLCFGFGVSNHHTLVLLAPIPFVLSLRWRTRRAVVIRAVGAGILGFLVGCSPVLSLLNADRAAPFVYGDWDSAQLVRHVLRLDYGALRLSSRHNAYGESLWHFARNLPRHTALVGPLLLVLGIVQARRWGVTTWSALFASTVLTGPVFLALMNIPADEEPVVIARFFALPLLLMVPWIAMGVSALFPSRVYPRFVAIMLAAVLVAHGIASRHVSNRATEQVYEMHVRQMLSLASRPDVQVLVSASDLEDYGLAYGKHVLGLAPKATIVMLGPIKSPWYRARLASQLQLPAEIASAGIVPLLELLNSRSPLFVVDAPDPPRPAMFARARPLGGLLVVIPEGAGQPSWLDLLDENTQVLDELSILPSSDRNTPLSGWELRLIRQHRDRWRELCEGVRRDGHPTAAASCDVRGKGFGDVIERLGSTRW